MNDLDGLCEKNCKERGTNWSAQQRKRIRTHSPNVERVVGVFPVLNLVERRLGRRRLGLRLATAPSAARTGPVGPGPVRFGMARAGGRLRPGPGRDGAVCCGARLL